MGSKHYFLGKWDMGSPGFKLGSFYVVVTFCFLGCISESKDVKAMKNSVA